MYKKKVNLKPPQEYTNDRYKIKHFIHNWYIFIKY